MLDSKNAAQSLVDQAAPFFSRASDQAGALAHRSADALRDSTERLRQTAQRATDGTVGYIRKEPGKSMFMAVAIGAALAVLLTLTARSSSDRR